MRASTTMMASLLVLASALAPTARATAADPVATLGVGSDAFWDADARPAVAVGRSFRRDYPVELSGVGSTFRVSIDSGWPPSFRTIDLISPTGRSEASAQVSTYELFLDSPAVGTWTVRVWTTTAADTRFRLRARLDGAPNPKPNPPVQLLPNLKLVPPFEFAFSEPYWPYPGVPGTTCSVYEAVEHAARRCLRFSTGPGNAGPGPFQLRFAPLEGLVTTGNVYQRVYDTSGAFIERPAGTFEYHKTHMHYHHTGFGSLELWRVTDPVAGTLERAGEGPKQGYCTADIVLFEWRSFLDSRQPTASECGTTGWSTVNAPLGTTMGITPGWADIYTYEQDGNYVEFPAGGGGLFVVRSTADAQDWVLESNENDNTSYAYISVQGGQIEVLERGYGLSPWDAERAPADDLMQPLA